MPLNIPDPLAVQPASPLLGRHQQPLCWPRALPPHPHTPQCGAPHTTTAHKTTRPPLEIRIATAHYVLGVILRSQRHWYIGRVWPPSCLLSRCFAAVVFLGGWAQLDIGCLQPRVGGVQAALQGILLQTIRTPHPHHHSPYRHPQACFQDVYTRVGKTPTTTKFRV